MEEDREFGAEMNGETVRIVMDQTFDLEEDYLENLPVLLDGLEEECVPPPRRAEYIGSVTDDPFPVVMSAYLDCDYTTVQ